MLKPLLASSDLNVAEAWAIDYYHHGDSLPYNKDVVLASPETSKLGPLYTTWTDPKQSFHRYSGLTHLRGIAL